MAVHRDCAGNTCADVSRMARHYRNGIEVGMGGDPGVYTWLVASGMSQIDAKFIMDYAPIDKSVLLGLIGSGTPPYQALTVMYGGNPYMPNVDNPPLPSYRPPPWKPLPGYPQVAPPGPPPQVDAAGNQVSTAPTSTVTAPAPATGTTVGAPSALFNLPSSIGGVPLMYWVLGAGALYLLVNS